MAIRMISREHDGARILFRFFKAANDSFAFEATVREWSSDGKFVRLARTLYKTDRGAWLRVSDLVLLDVLEPQCTLRDRPESEKKKKRKGKGERVEGDEWKDADGGFEEDDE